MRPKKCITTYIINFAEVVNHNRFNWMDINKFLEQTAGNWFSQRTTYQIAKNQVENSKADLRIKILPPDDSQIGQLCQQHHLNSNLSLGAIASSWDNSPDWGKPKQNGSAMLVLIADENDSQTGTIFRLLDNSQKQIIVGHYVLGNDQALRLNLEQDSNCIEERIWFASPNLRLRTTIIKNGDEFTTTSFYSEIRKVVKK